MHVLLEMVKKDISIQQLPQVGPVLIPEMFRILTSDNVKKMKLKQIKLIHHHRPTHSAREDAQ